MTLGEKISELRNSKNMSQSDLAEKLDVSRQSVSKWETNASIPELDKLIQLSDLFEITLDELVLHKKPEIGNINEVTVIDNRQTSGPKDSLTQKIIGYILLTIGLNCLILSFFFGRLFIFVGIYALFCSIICLCAKKYALIIIGWVTTLILLIVSPYIFGFNFWHSILIGILFFALMFYTGHLIYRHIKKKESLTPKE